MEGKRKGIFFLYFFKNNLSCTPREAGKQPSMLRWYLLLSDLCQDDKAHESAFKDCFHTGVFHQPELGMEHKQHRNADVGAESWRPESKYSTALTSPEVFLIRNLKVFDLESWWIKFQLYTVFFSPTKKISQCYNTVAGNKFAAGRDLSSWTSVGFALPAVLQSRFITVLSFNPSFTLTAAIFPANTLHLSPNSHSVWLMENNHCVAHKRSLIHCPCHIRTGASQAIQFLPVLKPASTLYCIPPEASLLQHCPLDSFADLPPCNDFRGSDSCLSEQALTFIAWHQCHLVLYTSFLAVTNNKSLHISEIHKYNLFYFVHAPSFSAQGVMSFPNMSLVFSSTLKFSLSWLIFFK